MLIFSSLIVSTLMSALAWSSEIVNFDDDDDVVVDLVNFGAL